MTMEDSLKWLIREDNKGLEVVGAYWKVDSTKGRVKNIRSFDIVYDEKDVRLIVEHEEKEYIIATKR